MNRSLIGISIGCISAAVVGYLFAHQPFCMVADDAGVSSKRVRLSATQRDKMEPGAAGTLLKARSKEQLAMVKEDLRQHFKASPAAEQDWPLREKAAAILATLSAAELEGFAMEFLTTENLKSIRSQRVLNNALFHEILRQWGLKDHAAACQSLAQIHRGSLAEVFGQWQGSDPAAAREWLESARFPQGGDEAKALLQRNFLTQQVTDDFSTAGESLGKFDPENQQQMLLEWSKLLAHDPDKRAELLALVTARGDAELSKKCYQNLIGEMAQKSPADAANFIEITQLTEDQKDKLNDLVVGNWAMKDPVQAFAKWAELGRDDVPPMMFEALSRWSRNPGGRAQTIEWVKNLAPGPARDRFKIQLLGGNGYQQDAELSASLDNPTQRILHMKIVVRSWQETSPKDASDWLAKLPAEDRQALDP